MSEQNEIFKISDKAKEQIKKIFEKETPDENRGMRVGVVGGGCSGLSYKIDFSDKKENDNILTYEGFRVFIDPKSAIYLKDSTLDFSDGLNGKGFIFTNPNAQNTCGCGESFSI